MKRATLAEEEVFGPSMTSGSMQFDIEMQEVGVPRHVPVPEEEGGALPPAPPLASSVAAGAAALPDDVQGDENTSGDVRRGRGGVGAGRSSESRGPAAVELREDEQQDDDGWDEVSHAGHTDTHTQRERERFHPSRPLSRQHTAGWKPRYHRDISFFLLCRVPIQGAPSEKKNKRDKRAICVAAGASELGSSAPSLISSSPSLSPTGTAPTTQQNQPKTQIVDENNREKGIVAAEVLTMTPNPFCRLVVKYPACVMFVTMIIPVLMSLIALGVYGLNVDFSLDSFRIRDHPVAELADAYSSAREESDVLWRLYYKSKG